MTDSLVIDCVNKTCTTYESDPNGCTCDWDNWFSVCDWPEERKNKNIPIQLPKQNGKYYVRVQTCAGDRYEDIQEFSVVPRDAKCGFTGKDLKLHWSGNDEEQPYAWRELRNDDLND
jgi:hypothetical protein